MSERFDKLVALLRELPVALNEGERRFLKDLKAWCDANPDWLAERELYLLRNLSRGRGVGFFEAGGFHPDFILWA